MPSSAATETAETRQISGNWVLVGVITLAVSLVTVVALVLTDENVVLLSIGTLLFSGFAFAHGTLRYGLRAMVVFLVGVVVISWCYESLSIETGFPFGDYYYTSGLGAKIGEVPIAIMPSYFAFGYLSWTVASVLIGRRDGAISGSDLWVLPVVSSFIMVMWDLSMDPVCSTIEREWIWEDGGPYFGVPLTNFFGWFLTVFTFYFLFAVYLRTTRSRTDARVITTRAFWVLPIVMYASIAVDFWGEWLQGADAKRVTDEAGQVWFTDDILGSVVLVSVFAMIFVSALALMLLCHAGVSRARRCRGGALSRQPRALEGREAAQGSL